ncbi:MAG: NUDIX hydrolase [Roseinatronobacter sp.]
MHQPDDNAGDPDAQATPIRDAATVILLRGTGKDAQVLMGQRGASAAFMPEKFVFPGGALDDTDRALPCAAPLNAACARRLAVGGADPQALAMAAIRELWEETGLTLGRKGIWNAPPASWAGFQARGLIPDPSPLRFIFRAITPPGRPRRFDARFFLAPAEAITGDLDDFAQAGSELRHLRWIALPETRRLNLPFVTEVVLAELAAMTRGEAVAPSVPFFDSATVPSVFRRIR